MTLCALLSSEALVYVAGNRRSTFLDLACCTRLAILRRVRSDKRKWHASIIKNKLVTAKNFWKLFYYESNYELIMKRRVLIRGLQNWKNVSDTTFRSWVTSKKPSSFLPRFQPFMGKKCKSPANFICVNAITAKFKDSGKLYLAQRLPVWSSLF